MNKTIFLCGDPHGEFEHILQAIEERHPAAVIILGDLTPKCSLDVIFKDVCGTLIYWIPGNHDTDTDLTYDRLWRSSFAPNNLHGRVQEICGIRFAGLGGVFRGQVWMPPEEPSYASPSLFIRKLGRSAMWRGGLPRRHRSTIFQSMVDKLKVCEADILLTHEAPSMHDKGFAVLNELAQSMGAKMIFHAHQHESRCYEPRDGIAARGIGLRGIIDLEGNIIVPAQIDPRELKETKRKEEGARNNLPHSEPDPLKLRPRKAPGAGRRSWPPFLRSKGRRAEQQAEGRPRGYDLRRGRDK